MIKMTVIRKWFTDQSTIGELYYNGKFECFTLEDLYRTSGVKVWGKTAIPCGVYNVVINMSNRFKRRMPLLLNVPGFEGIRIHSGNTPANTAGCILVGRTRGEDFIGQSKLAFESLFEKMEQDWTPCCGQGHPEFKIEVRNDKADKDLLAITPVSQTIEGAV